MGLIQWNPGFTELQNRRQLAVGVGWWGTWEEWSHFNELELFC